MNLNKIANVAVNLFDRFGKDMTPYGQGVSLLAHGLLSVIDQVQGTNKAPPPSPNIAEFYADADDDGIEDAVDADGGKVPNVTDEMIHAAAPIVQNWGSAPEVGEFPFAAVYLAMHAARPKK